MRHPSLKRSMRKGLRPVSSSLKPPPNIHLDTLEKMRELLFEEVLADGKVRQGLDQRQIFVVDHVQKVIAFHLGEESYQEINRHFEEGYKDGVKLNEEEISALTYLILEEKEKGQLNVLLNKLEGKVIPRAVKNN